MCRIHLRRAGDLEYARKLVTRVQGGDYSAQTPIQQQAFALRGWIDASIKQPQSNEEISILKESIRQVPPARGSTGVCSAAKWELKGLGMTALKNVHETGKLPSRSLDNKQHFPARFSGPVPLEHI